MRFMMANSCIALFFLLSSACVTDPGRSNSGGSDKPDPRFGTFFLGRFGSDEGAISERLAMLVGPPEVITSVKWRFVSTASKSADHDLGKRFCKNLEFHEFLDQEGSLRLADRPTVYIILAGIVDDLKFDSVHQDEDRLVMEMWRLRTNAGTTRSSYVLIEVDLWRFDWNPSSLVVEIKDEAPDVPKKQHTKISKSVLFIYPQG